MRPVSPTTRLSFQAKVLVAVLAVLVLLPAATVWIVNDHMGRQMQEETGRTLLAADASFHNWLRIRAQTLLSSTRNLANDPKLRAVAQNGDRMTMKKQLRDLLDELRDDHELVLFTSSAGDGFSGARRDGAPSLEDFATAANAITRIALSGEPATGTASLRDRTFDVVAVPVTLPDGTPLGVLTLGIRLGESAVQELKALIPRIEIFLFADDTLTATSVRTADLPDGLMRRIRTIAVRDGDGEDRAEVVVVNNERFLARPGVSDNAAGANAFRYLLLASVEQPMRALEQTRQTLVGVSVAGILIAATVVWFFVRRITQPLRELRDSAEAVGRGDFSRKIGRFSNDECGELAQAFNRMTANLQSSRAELEKTLSTLKNTQAQLIQSEKLSAVGQFVAGVAHELNNPLTAVIGFSDFLSSTQADEKTAKHLDLIAKSAHRCHKIVQSLLSFARQHAPERRLVEINSVIDEVLEIMAYDLRTSNVTVVKEFGERLPSLMADPHQLQQVFVNILGNARQAIEPFRRDGRIIVRTRLDGGRVLIEFQDNGPGIRAENVARIFDPFFTTKPVGKGTGLGLSLSYGIIQEHGGGISVKSEVGQGATFAIELPAATVPGAILLEEPLEKRTTRAAVAPGTRVLVVDDEEWILELTQELLRSEGYEVEAVSTGEAALACINEETFEVIISDWKMPGLNGMHLYEQLLTTNPAAARRMLFMTGDVISEAFQDFLRRHARTCLPKPFALEEFRAAVAAVLMLAK